MQSTLLEILTKYEKHRGRILRPFVVLEVVLLQTGKTVFTNETTNQFTKRFKITHFFVVYTPEPPMKS